MFFVISGFIIPYSLHRAGYELSHYKAFLLKRLVRLDPPYIVTIFLIIALNSIAVMVPGFNGTSFSVSFPQVALHFAYLNVFFGYQWLSPVFWTLAIEFQYYLLIGLFFPLITHSNRAIRVGSLGLLLALNFSPGSSFVFHWLTLFIMGIAAFQVRMGLVDKREAIVWLAATVICGSYSLGLLIVAVGIITAIILAWANFGGSNVLLFLGKVSYSLYLVHVLIGMKVINLGSRWAAGWPAKLIVLTVALAASIAAAYALYRLVEHPAQKWSSMIGLRKINSKPLIVVTQDV